MAQPSMPKLLELMLLKRSKENTKCVSAAGEELTAAKQLKLFRDAAAAAHMKVDAARVKDPLSKGPPQVVSEPFEELLLKKNTFSARKHPSRTLSLCLAMCRGTPVMSAGFHANTSRWRLNNPHSSFRPSSVRVDRGTPGSETIEHSSGMILLLCNVTIPLATGNFIIPCAVDEIA
nr:hypothetical protein [Tanacetum cinerariifolium]